ncbi:hypothetical protein Cgig2_033850 [Carnegiea gigantea]|uniref:Uncharacterized protein n=1 Tax=Carnegiea gigantea TaxID=171969 RepID=A0A9Q1JIQ2_9CARY|nr:hypothetical protein Cgig2_033850 [Carnegiea gigantea]
MNLKKTPPQSCKSADGESSRTIHAANAPLRRWRMSVHNSFYGLSLDFLAILAWISDLRRRWRKKAVERLLRWRRVWSTCHPSKADLMVKVESNGATDTANAPLRLVARRPTRIHFHGGGVIWGMVWADWGFEKTKEEEGSQQTSSSATRIAHAPPLRCRSDGRGLFLTKVLEDLQRGKF